MIRVESLTMMDGAHLQSMVSRAIKVLERPGPVGAKYWGYHEYMHIFITLGFVLNVFGVLNIASTCPADRWASSSS